MGLVDKGSLSELSKKLFETKRKHKFQTIREQQHKKLEMIAMVILNEMLVAISSREL